MMKAVELAEIIVKGARGTSVTKKRRGESWTTGSRWGFLGAGDQGASMSDEYGYRVWGMA